MSDYSGFYRFFGGLIALTQVIYVHWRQLPKELSIGEHRVITREAYPTDPAWHVLELMLIGMTIYGLYRIRNRSQKDQQVTKKDYQ